MLRDGSLLERDDELARLDQLIAASVAGEGGFVVIEGRSGVGKSALLAALRWRATAAGMQVYAASGSQLEGELAFGAVRQLFETPAWAAADAAASSASADAATSSASAHAAVSSDLFRGAARLAAPVLGLAGAGAGGDQLAALHGLYWLAANLAARAPLLLILDDAHWADVASLRWLSYLHTRLQDLPILVALSTRPVRLGGQGEALTSLVASSGVELVELGPLGEASVVNMLRSALGADPDPAFAQACCVLTAGNPLALRSLLRDLIARGVLRPTAAAAANLDQQAPASLVRRVLAQLARLGEPATQLCRALAVLGDGTPLRRVAALAHVEAAVASDLADDLAAADLLARERPLRFVHPLLRTAVYDNVPPGARSRLHAAAAALCTAAAFESDATAVARLGEAVEVLSGSPAALELAQALLDQGMRLRRLRHPVDARAPL